ncbi:MAG: protein-(glutamine-N5) methyltransferase, release factor-specific [Gemmatimonadetes bacterium]|nr:protein-(glutamine-N5) methyltransferase, release factor-specific [Gemmatimonadota bacterium]
MSSGGSGAEEVRDAGTATAASVAELFASLSGRLSPETATEIISALYDVPKSWVKLEPNAPVDDVMHERAMRAMDMISRGAPLQYAVGTAAFRALTLDVDERVLIPRPETELLVDIVLEMRRGRSGGIAVDVGTGSGCIALSLGAEGNFDRVIGTDVSLDAIAVARQNAGRCAAVLNAPVEFMHGSLLSPVLSSPAPHAPRPCLVVSNPPYIALSEASQLPANVRDWEPFPALFSGGEGMDVTRQLIRQAGEALDDGGILALEVDARRASLAAELVAQDGRFENVAMRLDLTGRERFVVANRQER